MHILTTKADQKVCHKLLKCFNTSIPVHSVNELGNKNVHIIPMEDKEQTYNKLDSIKQAILINKLDKIKMDRQYCHETICIRQLCKYSSVNIL